MSGIIPSSFQALQSTSFPATTETRDTAHLTGDTVQHDGRSFTSNDHSSTGARVNDSMVQSNLGSESTASTGRARRIANIVIGASATLIGHVASKVAGVGKKIFDQAQKLRSAEGRSELKDGIEREAQQIKTKLGALKETASKKLQQAKTELPGRISKFTEEFPGAVRSSVKKIKEATIKFFQQLRSSEGRKELKKDFEAGMARLKKGANALMEKGSQKVSQMEKDLQPKLDAYEAKGATIVEDSNKGLKEIKKEASQGLGELKKAAGERLSTIKKSIGERMDDLRQRLGNISLKRSTPAPLYDETFASNTIDILKQRLDIQNNNLQKNIEAGSDAGTIKTREIEIGDTVAALKLLEDPSKLNKFIKTQKKEHADNLAQIKEYAEGGIKQNEVLTAKLKQQMGEVFEAFGDTKLETLREKASSGMDEKHAVSKENNKEENILILLLKKENPDNFECQIHKGLGEVTGPSNSAKMETKEFIKHLHDNLPGYLGLNKDQFRTKPSGQDPSGELLPHDKENNLAEFKRLCMDKGLNAEDAAGKAGELNDKYNQLIDAKRNLEIDGGSKYMSLVLELKEFIDAIK